MSLVTDTVGTLVASRYKHQDAMVGVILGTGSNGAYIEQAENIHNAPKPLPAGSEMVINCEWGNFSCDALPFLEEDEAIDAESTNAGSQHFEKLTAGLCCHNVMQHALSADSENRHQARHTFVMVSTLLECPLPNNHCTRY